ncbi:MAG: DUF262 domain-containing protein [Microcoleus sp. PH2017_10_PVI_O_A]|nr:DUF262 domain-containing protein [Microcoleus sp. PH2017_10_PVI_O_A]MCC3460458.1 DUF262 domain-containing protein [Microcoleus sp. PH2017_11_PCY_U_A]MCC3478731.1 DUF262 domain-containing protein [Microcoleus sp. PH2017_12_PCY_D_A]MCC3528867.1 DUF262 domain-containing protein [Microcoleus sp. PH2017_21_RUC_O_A]MCC3541045.1 DUF262 domain-containing protein [Microcoleus sp. PH2017_22_RUC_O_B]MCC3559677.1 DUF262 domain-containing protein [Microcoleus sp. PH2017_27_LUM_O_A]TAE85187.1 MAG: DUF26
MRSQLEQITLQDRNAAEMEIRDKQKQINYDTRDYPLEILVQKYMEGVNDDTNKLFIPNYQRELVWDDARQSKFIESVIWGLPIPSIFVVDIGHDENDEPRLEIVYGAQRILTLTRFVNNELTLSGLKKIEQLNGFKFSDLLLPRQRNFNRKTVRTIQLTEAANKEVRRDLFERIQSF